MGEATAKKFKMMKGTSGADDYLVVARKGNVVLGVKVLKVVPASPLGAKDHVWFPARLRSAPADTMFDDEPNSNVVKLEKKYDNLAEPWPSITWEKVDEYRASTIVGLILPGRLVANPDEIKEVVNYLSNGEIANKLADYLYNVAGGQNMILTKEEIVNWLQSERYLPMAKSIEKGLKQATVYQEEVNKVVGTFAAHTEILKNAYKKFLSAENDDEHEDVE
jgi:hypothetical protein